MKVRNGFVSNSSSSSFVIRNTSDEELTLVDFVKENPQLVKEFCLEYDWHDISQEEMITSAGQNSELLFRGDNALDFGDEDGTIIGMVFDYILRDGGKSANFEWKCTGMNR